MSKYPSKESSSRLTSPWCHTRASSPSPGARRHHTESASVRKWNDAPEYSHDTSLGCITGSDSKKTRRSSRSMYRFPRPNDVFSGAREGACKPTQSRANLSRFDASAATQGWASAREAETRHREQMCRVRKNLGWCYFFFGWPDSSTGVVPLGPTPTICSTTSSSFAPS